MVLTIEQCSSVSSSLDQELDRKDTYWSFNCVRCHQQVKLCRPCSRSYRYCKQCSVGAQEESKRRARKSYQSGSNGREQHRLSQQRYRARHRENREITRCQINPEPSNQRGAERCEIETLALLDREASDDVQFRQHHEDNMPSVMDLSTTFSLNHEAITTLAIDQRQEQAVVRLPMTVKSEKLRCDMCGALCGPFAMRRRSWQQERRRRNKQKVLLKIIGDQMRISPNSPRF
jgi:hypothetical protein